MRSWPSAVLVAAILLGSLALEGEGAPGPDSASAMVSQPPAPGPRPGTAAERRALRRQPPPPVAPQAPRAGYDNRRVRSRPPDEWARLFEQALAVPDESTEALQALSISGTATSWASIGYGIVDPDGVHHKSGRIRSMAYAYDPSQAEVLLFAASSSGGLYKLNHVFGVPIWSSLTATLPARGAVGAFLVHPQDGNRILLGTGDRGRGGDEGSGVYRTSDGGKTWSLTSLSPIPTSIDRIINDVSDPSDYSVVLAVGSSGLWRSEDFGTSWTRHLSNNISDLVQDTVNPHVFFAGVPGIGVMRSDNWGTIWSTKSTGIGTPIGRVALTASRSQPGVVFAVVAAPDGSLSGIYRSVDWAEHWTRIEPAGVDTISGGQGFHACSIAVDPNNAGRLFVGLAGVQWTENATAATVQWHRNIGDKPACCTSTCTCVDWNTDIGHADITGFLFVPSSISPGNTEVWVSNDGGLYRFNWVSRALDGSVNLAWLNIAQDNGIGLWGSPTDPATLVAGLQDNGQILVTPGAAPFVKYIFPGYSGADGGPGGVQTGNSDTLVAAVGAPYSRFVSFNKGQSWVDVTCNLPQDWGPTMMFHPIGGDSWIYTNSGRYAYRRPINGSCGGGNDWQAINGGHPFPVGFNAKQLDIANSIAYRFYVTGWGSDRLYSIEGSPGSASWSDRTPPLPAGSSRNDCLVFASRVGGNDAGIVYYLTANAHPARAFESHDYGASWADVTGDLATRLPDATFYSMASPYDEPNTFVLATDVGVFRSDDHGAHWYRYMSGLPRFVVATSLAVFDDVSPDVHKLRLGTWGNGFWERTIDACAPPGDVDGNCALNVSDVFYLINRLFAGGPAPSGVADANGDGKVDVSDVFFLVNYLFAGGPRPS